jgi:hypothetical protein
VGLGYGQWFGHVKGSNYLAGILASLKEASTENVADDVSRV